MTVTEYISKQPQERQKSLTALHNVILENDKTVIASVGPMMGKQMIIYDAGIFKYALSSVKDYVSLHVLPMYGSPTIYSKYLALLPKAKFQKGCINFRNPEEIPLNIVQQLIQDCSKIDLLKIREEYQKSKKEKSKMNK